jgi:hypothetical protein
MFSNRRNLMATEETQTKRDDKHIFDDSPITVGGGGGKKKDKDKDKDTLESNVRCTFNDDDFQEEGNPDHGRKKLRHKGNGKIKTFRLRLRGNWTDHSDLLPAPGNCTIVISCSEQDDDVIINGNKFGIDINPNTYVNVGDGVHRNPDAASFITNVVLNIGGQLTTFHGPFSEDDDCAVCTDHMPNSTHCPDPN